MEAEFGCRNARVETVALFTQAVYLLFAAVYVCKETVEHLLLSIGQEGKEGHHHHSGDEAVDIYGCVVQCIGMRAMRLIGDDWIASSILRSFFWLRSSLSLALRSGSTTMRGSLNVRLPISPLSSLSDLAFSQRPTHTFQHPPPFSPHSAPCPLTRGRSASPQPVPAHTLPLCTPPRPPPR